MQVMMQICRWIVVIPAALYGLFFPMFMGFLYLNKQRDKCWEMEIYVNCPSGLINEQSITYIVPIVSAASFVYLAYFCAPKYKKIVATGAFGLGTLAAIILGNLVGRGDAAALAILAGGLILKFIYSANKVNR